MGKDLLEELETNLGYTFRNKSLLLTACIHRSYKYEKGLPEDNQRLEFLGDAVLGFLLADYMYKEFKDHQEGDLTVLRSTIAKGSALADVANVLGLGKYLMLGRGEELSGGQERLSNLEDMMEAVFAAVYLDGGMDAVRDVFIRIMNPILSGLTEDKWSGNPKGLLQHICQKYYRSDPVYTVCSIDGPKHNVSYRVSVSFEGEDVEGVGTGPNRKSAEAAAAVDLLSKLPERE